MEKQLLPCRENEILTAVNALDNLVLEFHGSCPFQPIRAPRNECCNFEVHAAPWFGPNFYKDGLPMKDHIYRLAKRQRPLKAAARVPYNLVLCEPTYCCVFAPNYFHAAPLAKYQIIGMT
jgi:hypothetical protein